MELRTESARRERAERFAVQLSRRDELAAVREQEYAALVARHAELEADLDREVARVAGLEAAVAHQRDWIAEQDAMLARARLELDAREAAIIALEAQIELMRGTRAWRLATTFWRWRGR